MGFLNRTVFAKRLNKSNFFVLAFVASIISCGLATVAFSSSAFAVETVSSYGLYTAPDGVRWEWEVVTDDENETEPTKLNLMFYDKPENLTTVTVPSYTDMTTMTGITPVSDTYYVRNANQESQDTRFTNPDPARRTANQTDVTILDMTNTSKVQIMGVQPIINPETEVELIFGENMVIGDGVEITATVTADKCVETGLYGSWSWKYECKQTEQVTFENVEALIPDWNDKTLYEKSIYTASSEDLITYVGCTRIYSGITYEPDVINNCYITKASVKINKNSGTFAGYKLKLTNFGNLKYVGWHAFTDSVFNDDNATITIDNDAFTGEDIFANTNVKKAIINSSVTGVGLFRNCNSLTEIEFGDGVNTVNIANFEGTNLGTLDLSTTNVKNILGQAFKNANLTSINIEGVQKLDYESFANNDLTELYLPKSINDINTTRIFEGNMNLTKLTIAYDTLTSGTDQQLIYTIGAAGDGNTDNLGHRIRDLTILAPYGANEQVSETHMTYSAWNVNGSKIPDIYDDYGVGLPHDHDSRYGKADTYKNVLAPGYFNGFWAIENLTIGEGYEFIGANAFYNYLHGPARDAWGRYMYTMDMDDSINSGMINKSFHVSLPETLKGIGGNAFSVHLEGDFQINLPESLEYIGKKAFRCSTWFKNNIDLPNLRYLGTQAFLNTGFYDVYLHDSLEYVGYAPFEGGWNLHDTVIDFDAFGPNSHMFEGGDGVSGVGGLTVAMFGDLQGHNWTLSYSPHFERILQLVDSDRLGYSGLPWEKILHKVGTIKFTSKATTPWPTDANENIYASWSSYGVFYGLVADKVDLSETNWKHLPQRAFLGANVGEVVLPHALEYIGRYSFQYSHIEQELVLPDSVKVIGQDAFSMYGYLGYVDYRGIYTDGSYLNPVYRDKDGNVVELTDGQRFSHATPVKITKLPRSLEYVGGGAFYGNAWLEADFDCPNAKVLGYSAFLGTNLKSVTIGDKIKGIYLGAFYANENLKSLTFNGDVSKAIFTPNKSYEYNNAEWPFSILDNSMHYNNTNYIEPTFYPIFGQLDWFRYYAQDPDYDKSGWQNNRDELDSVVFTEKASTTLSGAYDFAMYKIKNVDLSRVEWDNLPEGMFNNAEVEEIKLPIYLSMGKSCRPFQWANVTGKVILPDGANHVQEALFQHANIKEVVLPDSIRIINQLAFFNARIEDELVLPEGLLTIKDNAFNSTYYLNTLTESNPEGDTSVGTSVKITKLPSTLETVGEAAFFGAYLLDADLDAPNLKTIGRAAFMKTSLKNVKLYDKLESIGSGAFLFVPTLNDLYLDLDFFDVAARIGYYYGFYSTFSTAPRYSSFQSQSIDKSTFGDVVFTEKNITNPEDSQFFMFFTANSVDIANVKWTKLPGWAFFGAIVAEPVTIPETVTVIDQHAFQESQLTLTNAIPEGVTTINHAAFFATDVTDDLVIPSTVTSIGTSAFNAGPVDVHYDTVMIKPADLSYTVSSGQAIFQMFWDNLIDKMVIDSEILPVMSTLAKDESGKYISNSGQIVCVDYRDSFNPNTLTCRNSDDEETPTKTMPEFHGMTMEEVVLNNAGAVMANAFEENASLEKVDFGNNANLQFIGRNAFAYDDKLKAVAFGNGLAGKDVSLGSYAFRGTAIETIGDANSGFNLAAANFNTVITSKDRDTDEVSSVVDGYVFAEMPQLKFASIPGTFSIDASLANTELHTNGSTIPSYTFADDPELTTVEVGYQLSTIREDAFANDNKLSKIFLWGNTDIEENGTNLTIPEPTNIFAYSDAPAENYANADSRSTYDGKFYPLDEVLYLTSNKTYVVLEQDEEGNNVDFEKDGLILYALRRDGVILESDDWQTYTKAFTRASNPNIKFDEGRGGNLGADDSIMWTVYDAPKPFNTISLANRNFEGVDFEFIDMPSSTNPLVAIHYPDGYTAAIRTTTLASMTKEEEEKMLEELEVPNTGVIRTIAGVAVPSVSVVAIIVLSGIYIARKSRKNGE